MGYITNFLNNKRIAVDICICIYIVYYTYYIYIYIYLSIYRKYHNSYIYTIYCIDAIYIHILYLTTMAYVAHSPSTDLPGRCRRGQDPIGPAQGDYRPCLGWLPLAPVGDGSYICFHSVFWRKHYENTITVNI